MKFHPTPLALALAAALGSLAVLPASAALVVNTPSVDFNNSASVTDPEGGAATTNNGASLGSSSIQQFNASQGVLMGTTLNLSSTRTQTTTATAAGQSSSSNDKTTAGTGSSTAQLSAPGVLATFGSISANASCTGAMQAGCSAEASAVTATNTAAAVAAANLDSYVGAGTVLATRTAPGLSATQTDSNFPGAESTKSSVTWAGKLSATYEYLLHASASFDGVDQLSLDMDFGSFTQGSGTQQLAFQIFNAAGDRVGLDLDSFDAGSGPFSTNLDVFSALLAGDSMEFLAYFDTSAAGDFSHSYTLFLSDADVGAASSRWNDYRLTLNLSGEVTPRAVNGVPEPSVLALTGLALLGLHLTRRRRRAG